MITTTRHTLVAWIVVAVPTAIFLAHGSMFGTWIVDDAGISFAYARNLAQGQGLVSQPGAAPVEGFTNLLWVLLLAGSIAVRLFDPLITPKVLSAICVFVTFALMGRLLVRQGGWPPWIATVASSITAGITGFTVWCLSGLENPLYAMLVAAVAVVATGAVAEPTGLRLRAAVCAGLVFLVFCTRPDGALYFWIPPLILAWVEASETEASPRERRLRSPWVVYIAVFAGLWAVLTIFRSLYFHDVLPNTFYAKKAEGVWFFKWLLAHMPAFQAALVVVLLGSLIIVGVGWACNRVGRWLSRHLPPALLARHASILFLLTAALVYVALPGDWMGEYRFATPMFVFAPAAVVCLLLEVTRRARAPRYTMAAIVVVLLVGTGLYAREHSTKFARRPTTPFEDVRRLSRRIASVVAPLGPEASVLTPDIGGALWEDRFRVIDYVGLIDRSLGRVVGRAPERLRDQILEVLNPDAIWLHSNWLREVDILGDPRFQRRYAAVWEERVADGSPVEAGLYLRRDFPNETKGASTHGRTTRTPTRASR